jgi:antitoxin component YwqK of YwqJK toxin-antitoxin module
MTLADGTIYDGHYSHGLKDGEGTLILPDGTRQVGTFTNDLKNGTFKEYDAQGKLVKNSSYVNGMMR